MGEKYLFIKSVQASFYMLLTMLVISIGFKGDFVYAQEVVSESSILAAEEEDGKTPVKKFMLERSFSFENNLENEEIPSLGAASNIKWDYSDGKLTISGSGKMQDYSSIPPWYRYLQTTTEIIIEEGVTSVGRGSFYRFYNVTKVTLPMSVVSIREGAFADCERLVDIKFGSKLTTIEKYAFQGCGFKEIELPASLKTLNFLAFFDASKIERFTVANGNKVFLSKNGILFSDGGSTIHLYPQGRYDTSYTIPSTVKKIGDGAFLFSKLNSIAIPKSVTKVGDSAFQESNIINLKLPDSVNTIGDFICYKSQNLQTVTIGKGIKKIPYMTFTDCKNLANVNLKVGVKEIHALAFSGCKAIKSVKIPSSVEIIASSAFPTTTKLVNLPAGLTKMDDGSYKIVAKVTVKVKEHYKMSFEVLNLINKERKKAGRAALVMDKNLLETAMLRASETSIYWNHERPDGTSCYSASNLMMGENVAMGQSSPSNVMKSWMSSPGHKSNILSTSFKTVGIGCVNMDGNYYWVQCFGTKGSKTVKASAYADKTVNKKILVSTDKNYYKPKMTLSAKSIKVGSYANALITWQNGLITVKLPAKGLKFKSSNTSVCTVSADGRIRGKNGGTATIKAWFPGYEKGAISKKITVIGPNNEKTYTVKFNKNGGSKLSTSSKKVKRGSKLGNFPKVQRKNYDLKGWYTKKSGGTKVTANTKINKNQTFYAQWKKTVKPKKAIVQKLVINKSNQMTVQLKKVNQAKGYEIVYSDKSSFKRCKRVHTKKLKTTIKKQLSNGKIYYVKVRAYKLDSANNKIYGNYSRVMNVKIQ